MIRQIARCPYCDRGVIGLDDDGLAIVFNPDGLGTDVCRHLAFLWAMLEAHSGRTDCVRCRSRAWLWEHGRGLYPHRGRRDEPLSGYLLDLVYDSLGPEERVTGVEYHVAGGTAEEREAVRVGTGFFRLARRERPPLQVELYGWAVYSPLAGRFADAVRRLIGRLR
jgi:hypothetical protein